MTETYMTQPENMQPTMAVSLESWGWSHQGSGREDNQDSFLNWAERTLWAVADGVGGSDHGGAASKFLVRSLMQVRPPVSLAGHVSNVVRQLEEGNDLLRVQSRVAGTASSTIVTLLMHEGKAVCLWAGDSRCYLLRSGVLYQCTKDHTLRQEKIDNGELTAPEAARMVRANIITNAVGVRDKLKLDEVRFDILPGDRFLLCTDGLTGIMSPETLSTHLAKSSAKEAVHSVVEALGSLEQPDNITFVAVFLSATL